MYLQSFAVGRRSTKVIGFCISVLCAFSISLDAFSAEPADSNYQIAGASGADPVKFGKWYESFRKAVVKNDRQALAKMISNPLSVYVGDGYDDYTGQKTESSDRSYGPSAFLKNYDHIFTKPLRNRLATAWKSEFWDRDQGVCLGTGMVWFDVLNDGASYKLKTINVSAGPNDIDGILSKIKTEEKEKANSDAIANLYSDLGRAYKDDWRCYGDERVKIEKPICLKKAELAFSKAISLRTGNKSKSAEQAKDLWLLADTLQEETGKAEMAESNFLKSLAMQQAVLPPAAPSIGSTLDKLKELDADAPLKLDAVLKMELPFKEASIQAKEKSLTAKTSNTKKKELADNYIQLGDIYSRLNRKDEAQKSYGKAYVLWKGMNPKNDELSTDLTRVFAEQGKVAEAKNICSSISDFTFKTMAEDSLILGLAKSGKFAEAEKLLSAEVSKIESDHSGERRLAGYVEVYLIGKKLDKALSLAELAVKKTNSDVGYDTALEVNAKVESLLGHYEKAEACLQAAHDYLANRYPTDPPKLLLYRKLAELYLINKKYPQALTICDQIISKYDNFDRQCVLYSDVLGLKAQVLAAQSSPLAAETFQKAFDIKSKIQDPKDKSVVDLKLAYDKFQNQSKH